MERSDIMRRVRSKNTKPELAVRRALRRAGYRFRLHAGNLPGKPDIFFPSKKAAIFVHGCWWHKHSCKRGRRRAVNNAGYWRKKIARNARRDVNSIRALRRNGWRVAVVWECQLADMPKVMARLDRVLHRA